MKLDLQTLSLLLAFFVAGLDGLSISYRMKAHETKACFDIRVPDASATIQLYYAVASIP